MVGKGSDILLVEDEPLVLEATAQLLADAGYSVTRASTCDEAMAALDAGCEPSIVITDINLSADGDGIDLARCVSELWPDVRLIIVSGAQRPSPDDYPEGAIFFTKPYAPGALVSMCADPAAA